MVEGRTVRFGDWDELKGLSLSGHLGNSLPFFAGESVQKRMDFVRKSVENIRQNWNQFDQFMASLESAIDGLGVEHLKRGGLARNLSGLLYERRTWIDRLLPNEELPANYDAIHLYTSDQGYRQVFSMVNRVFRSEFSPDFGQLITNAVFLIELLNIDLYNYSCSNPELKNFEGTVYRGMCVTAKEFQAFSRITQGPIGERFISIPLGLVSASRNPREAELFLENKLREAPQLVPMLWKVHVVDLEDQLLNIYRHRFPDSAVSTICAVPIRELSDFPQEEEVLLRGPFFQILACFQQGKVDGKPVCVLEAVMVNSNRDHISSVELGVGDTAARTLFGTIVGLRRNQFCLDYCEKNDLPVDANFYRTELEVKNRRLSELISEG